ncbi:MAG: glycosyl transferase [Butyrivibrio sp.]|nr:glycosyl transferase [Butyrivibrio sp.]
MEVGKIYKIPRVIHYFWFGRGEKPQSVKKCIASWKKKCPDFVIKEWNESNYDIHKHPYMEKAYMEKKWAFVSDYARLDILYNYGGIYLDTDVEVLKDLSHLCTYKAFMGFENAEFVNDGQGFGCVPGLQLFKEMLEIYDGEEPYCYENGELQYKESPRLRTKVLLRHGLKPNGLKQTVGDVVILPTEYLCPLDNITGRLFITNNTYSIHHFEASWKSGRAKKYWKLLQRLSRVFGKKLGRKIFNRIMKSKDAFKKMIGR